MCEHFGISALTGERVKGDDDHAIKKHLLSCNHRPDFEDFSILTTKNSDFKVTLMKSILINRDHPPLNKNKQELFFNHMSLYLADLNLVACDFVSSHLIVILKQNVNFSFNI